jgi:hypothetical protein
VSILGRAIALTPKFNNQSQLSEKSGKKIEFQGFVIRCNINLAFNIKVGIKTAATFV